MKSSLKIQIIFLIIISSLKYTKSCFEYSCEECSSEEYGSCTKCKDTFNLLDGTCPCASSGCAICKSGYYGNKLCIQCKKGYIYNNGECYCPIDYCERCSENGCLKCNVGYFYNSNTKKCEKNTTKIECYDLNCDICFSTEEGSCKQCKNGYTSKKGKCIKLANLNENGECPIDYYKKDKNDDFCYEKCYGIDCDQQISKNYFSCVSNKCLFCSDNILSIVSNCDNSDFCDIDNCLNCLTKDECAICTQGTYLIGGLCKKCIEGCASCSNSETCDYCLSGYELTKNKKCQKTNILDFNTEVYNLYQNKRNIYECDVQNCQYCNEKNECIKAQKGYFASNGDIIKCEENCKSCGGLSSCYECKSGYYLKNGICIEDSCSLFENCYSCNENECLKCMNDYKLNKNGQCVISAEDVNNESNRIWIVIPLVSLIVLPIIVIIITMIIKKYCCKKQERNSRHHQDRNEANVNVINVRVRNSTNSSLSNRYLYEKKLEDEFESQKLKKEKGEAVCQFCKEKPGRYICDCGCVVCIKHSKLKKVEGENENYKVCFACDKIVKRVLPKYTCGICMENVLCLAHFKCDCALEVCKKCYVKCKLGSNKCPACRRQV